MTEVPLEDAKLNKQWNTYFYIVQKYTPQATKSIEVMHSSKST